MILFIVLIVICCLTFAAFAASPLDSALLSSAIVGISIQICCFVRDSKKINWLIKFVFGKSFLQVRFDWMEWIPKKMFLIELLPLQKYSREEFILVLNFSRSLPRILYRTFDFGFQDFIILSIYRNWNEKFQIFEKKIRKFLVNRHTWKSNLIWELESY